MREIKFRGRLKNGVNEYGIGVYVRGKKYYLIGENMGRITQFRIEGVPSQLIGFDFYDNEVYEGDVVVDEFGNEFKAGFDSIPYERMRLK